MAQTIEPGADKPSGVTLTGDPAVQTALALLVAQSQWQEAKGVLAYLSPAQRMSFEALFLEAKIERELENPKRAAQIYKRLLGRPVLNDRLRLELAQTYFEMGDYAASEHNFRLALSGKIAASDRKGVEAYLIEIAKRRDWRVSVGVAIAPDTNINAASDLETIEFLGLPFVIRDDARRNSGLGVYMTAYAERRLQIGKMRWAISAQGQVSDYSAKQFDDHSWGLRLGPELVTATRRRITPYMAYGKRRYSGTSFYDIQGLGMDVAAPIGNRKYYEFSASAQKLDFARDQSMDGLLAGAEIQRTAYLTAKSLWRLGAATRRYNAATNHRSYWEGRILGGYYRSLSHGFGAYVEPSILSRRYDGSDPLFGRQRHDVQLALAVRLTKQDYDLWGFSPFTQFEVYNNQSSIAIESYTRTRMQFGITRTF